MRDSTGSIRLAESLRTLLTRVDTGQAVVISAAEGRNSARAAAVSISSLTFNQVPKLSGARITGMRAWMGASASLAVVVMIVTVCNSLPSANIQLSHRPAKVSRPPSAAEIQNGRLGPTDCACHS